MPADPRAILIGDRAYRRVPEHRALARASDLCRARCGCGPPPTGCCQYGYQGADCGWQATGTNCCECGENRIEHVLFSGDLRQEMLAPVPGVPALYQPRNIRIGFAGYLDVRWTCDGAEVLGGETEIVREYECAIPDPGDPPDGVVVLAVEDQILRDAAETASRLGVSWCPPFVPELVALLAARIGYLEGSPGNPEVAPRTYSGIGPLIPRVDAAGNALPMICNYGSAWRQRWGPPLGWSYWTMGFGNVEASQSCSDASFTSTSEGAIYEGPDNTGAIYGQVRHTMNASSSTEVLVACDPGDGCPVSRPALGIDGGDAAAGPIDGESVIEFLDRVLVEATP